MLGTFGHHSKIVDLGEIVLIASWNVNSLKVRLEQVLAWMQTIGPDVLCLQETKMTDAVFPQQAFIDMGYDVLFTGQKTYNGVATISRLPMKPVITALPEYADTERRILAACVGDVLVVNVYVPNGSAPDSDKYAYKLEWLGHLQDWLKGALEQYPKLVVLGDFNIAPTDADVYDPAVLQGGILVSDAERAAFQGLLHLGFQDTFRLFSPDENIYSWWDYRQASFQQNHGLRIDLILASEALLEGCSTSFIDPSPRRHERPSDHVPVVAAFS